MTRLAERDPAQARPIPPGYRIARPRLFELYACQRVEARAATMFRDTRHAHVASGPVTGVGTLLRAWRRGMLWVAKEPGGRAVGFVMCSRQDGYLYVEELDVDPAHGRRGLGRTLLAQAVEAAEAEGLPTVTLSTFRDVPWNAPFYRKLGFSEWPMELLAPDHAAIAERHRGAGLDMHDRVFMRLNLA